ncbi:hypothetical protein P9112_012283 [Eukaryota sp. TZLM1-RC]
MSLLVLALPHLRNSTKEQLEVQSTLKNLSEDFVPDDDCHRDFSILWPNSSELLVLDAQSFKSELEERPRPGTVSYNLLDTLHSKLSHYYFIDFIWMITPSYEPELARERFSSVIQRFLSSSTFLFCTPSLPQLPAYLNTCRRLFTRTQIKREPCLKALLGDVVWRGDLVDDSFRCVAEGVSIIRDRDTDFSPFPFSDRQLVFHGSLSLQTASELFRVNQMYSCSVASTSGHLDLLLNTLKNRQIAFVFQYNSSLNRYSSPFVLSFDLNFFIQTPLLLNNITLPNLEFFLSSTCSMIDQLKSNLTQNSICERSVVTTSRRSSVDVVVDSTDSNGTQVFVQFCKKLADELGCTEENVSRVFKVIDEVKPFTKQDMDIIVKKLRS